MRDHMFIIIFFYVSKTQYVTSNFNVFSNFDFKIVIQYIFFTYLLYVSNFFYNQLYRDTADSGSADQLYRDTAD